MCSGNLAIALQSLEDIARYMDTLVEEHKRTSGQKGVAEWRHLEAVCNNWLKWKVVYDRNRGGSNGASHG